MNIVLLPKDTTDIHTITDPLTCRHIRTVLAATAGDHIKVGLLQGKLGQATVSHITETAITLTGIHCPTMPPAKLDLTVILALPRPKVLRRLILDMTAMGVQQLYLVNSYRSEKSYWQSDVLQRLDEFVQEGLQQACDTIPMTITLRKRLKPFVEDELAAIIADKQALIAHPYATKHFTQTWQATTCDSPHIGHVLVIGAEGGWIPYEVDLFTRHGCTPVSIGSRILRTENVVNVLCGHALLQASSKSSF